MGALTLGDVVADLERRAKLADAEGATAPVANIYRVVLAQLAPLALNGNGRKPPAPPEDVLLDVSETARRLRVTRRWLYAHAGDFPFTVRLPGRRLRFRGAGLAAWLERRR